MILTIIGFQNQQRFSVRNSTLKFQKIIHHYSFICQIEKIYRFWTHRPNLFRDLTLQLISLKATVSTLSQSAISTPRMESILPIISSILKFDGAHHIYLHRVFIRSSALINPSATRGRLNFSGKNAKFSPRTIYIL